MTYWENIIKVRRGNMKNWKKPVVFELSAEQLSEHIKAAARSGQCLWGDFR